MIIKLNFIIVASIVTVIWTFFRIRAHRRHSITKSREALLTVWFIYLLGVIYFTLSPFHFVIPIPGLYPRHFSFDTHLFLNLRQISDLNMQLYYSLANVVMTVPFGVLIPMLYRFARKIYLTALLGLGFSLTIELTQALFTVTRTATADDLFFNTVGAIVGYFLFRLCKGLYKKS